MMPAPTQVVCTRRIQFCAGHRVHRHESKCANLHGHNYVAFFHATAPRLDSVGRVIDFSVLKERLGSWVDTEWDHGFILYRDDAEAAAAVRLVAGQKLYFMDENPTAENMALHLLEQVAPRVLAGTEARVVRVVLWETENCFADVRLADQ